MAAGTAVKAGLSVMMVLMSMPLLAQCFSVPSALPSRRSLQHLKSLKATSSDVGDVLILDHLNINHEKGRHDLLRSFYFDFLQCAIDPRKAENLDKGKKTLWANIGSQQFHLPEGTPEAQVLDGQITLAFESLQPFKDRYESFINGPLQNTKFLVEENTEDDSLRVTDPWGTEFVLIADPTLKFKDARGSQPGPLSENGIAMTDLTLHATPTCNFPGIARFYEHVLGTPILSSTENSCVIKVGPDQTLTFLAKSYGDNRSIQHEQLVSPEKDSDETYPSNYGPHISMYVKDLRKSYRKAKEINALYVNPRFKRRAYTEEEAVDQCMFRCLDIIDPLNVEDGAILRVEHEVRSVLKKNGEKYKSCPFVTIPEGCIA